MSRHNLILLASLLIFAILAGAPVYAQMRWPAGIHAVEPAPTQAPSIAQTPTPSFTPASAEPVTPIRYVPATRTYLPLVFANRLPIPDHFWADRYGLDPGECTSLHWSVTDAIAVYLNDVPVTGHETRQVCPAITTTYVLRVVRASGTQDYCVTIVVDAGNHPRIEFWADAYRVQRGECTRLWWRVTEANAVYLNRQGVAGESSLVVCPSIDTTYVLDVEFANGDTATWRLAIAVGEAPTGEVTLWNAYQTGSAEETTLAVLIKNAQAHFPDFAINVLQIPFDQLFNKYQAEVAAGGGPDMFVAPNDDLGNWVRADIVIPLDDQLAGRLAQVSQVAVDGMKVNGKLYAVPESAQAVALYYNKALISNPPKTADELLQAVKNGKPLTLLLGAYHMFGLSGAFGGKLLDENNKCIADEGGWVDALQYVLDLKAAGALIEPDYGKAETSFRTGQAAMFINGPWALGDYKKDLGENLGVVPIPSGPGGKANPLTTIEGFYINPNSRNVDGALALALFLTNKDSSQIYTDKAGHVPIRSDVKPADPLIAAFAEASASGYPRPQAAEFGNFWTPFSDMWTKVVAGAVSPAEGIKEACAAMNEANGK
jgi:arabinogalactan oligomer/maltooligosaccharide transport system substrate-binding protein